MNKMRLIRVYELRGLIHPIEQYVIDVLDGIEKKIYPEYIIYKKEGIYYFEYVLNIGYISISSYLVTKFKTKFGCSIEETRELLKYLLEKHSDLKINAIG